MSTNVSLKWNYGAKQRRARQIPLEIWETHKMKIHELYRNKSLAGLVEIMKTKYGLDATARQYTFKLSQWGLSKQGAGKEQDVDPILESMSVSGKQKCDKLLPVSCGQKSKNMKRPNSRQIAGSWSSQFSLDPTPTSKRLKTMSKEDINGIVHPWNDKNFSGTSYMTSSEESQSMVSNTKSNEVIIAGTDSSNESDSQHINSPEFLHFTNGAVSSKRTSEAVDSETCLQFQRPKPIARIDWCVARLLEREPPCRERPPFLEQLKEPVRGSFPRSVYLDYCLSVSRTLDVFPDLSGGLDLPKQAEDQLKVVADYLFAVDRSKLDCLFTIDSCKAASDIYSVLLVVEEAKALWRTSSYTQRVPMLTPCLIASFRSARNVRQFKLVQDVLLKRMALEQNQSGSASELFLVHQFLADCYDWQGLVSEKDYHLKQSWIIAGHLNKLGDPRLTPDLSVLLYLCYKSAFPELPSSIFLNVIDANDASSWPGRLVAYGATPIGYDDFMVFCELVRNPLQGEKAAHRHKNILNRRILMSMRDCIEWCRSSVNGINGISDNLSRFNRFQAFEAVWDVWRGRAIDPQNHPRWATVPENELGISIAEHLYLCVEILFDIGGTKMLSVIPDHQLVDLHFQHLLKRVSAKSVQQTSSSGMRSTSSQIGLIPTAESSSGSSDMSLIDFSMVSQSIQQHVGAPLPIPEEPEIGWIRAFIHESPEQYKSVE